MVWVLGILKFIFSVIGLFTSGLFVTSCISSVINPQIKYEDGQLRDRTANSRYMFLLITSLAWGLVIALP